MEDGTVRGGWVGAGRAPDVKEESNLLFRLRRSERRFPLVWLFSLWFHTEEE